MEDVLPRLFEIEVFELFFLVAMRFSGLVVSAPVLGSANFPAMGKIGLIGLSALLVTPTLPALPVPIPEDMTGFVLTAAGEVLIGLAMGLVMQFLFAAIQLAGQVMDMQSGFGLMNVFNPALETQFPIFGFFYFILAVLFMLVTGLHHLMIEALAMSFRHVPIGGLDPDPNVLWAVTAWGSALFHDAVMIGAPVVAAMMLAYVTMGLLSRVVPQIHLFVVGFPLTIATGLFVVALTIDIFLVFLDGRFETMFRNVDTLVRGLG